MDEILEEFIVESTEALDALDVELIELEQNPSSTPTLSSIFRRIHTIKGTCGFLGFEKLERVTHVGENLLSKLRDGEMTVTPEITSALLHLTDVTREVIDYIASTGAEGPGNYSDLEEQLVTLTEGGVSKAEEEAGESPADGDETVHADDPATAETTDTETEAPDQTPDGETTGDEPAASETETAEVSEDGTAEAAAKDVDDGAAQGQDSDAAKIDWPKNVRVGDLLVSAGKATEEQINAAVERQNAGDPRHIGELLLEAGVIDTDDVVEVLNSQRQAAASVAESSIRVDVSLLDQLMNLVGELVLARNQILQFTGDTDDAALTATTQRLDLITTELQGSVMQTRMQPIENAWAKFPRIVRDLARQCGKQVRLETFGGETELDKTLLEAIRDPLTHIVRNAVDHGIEEPEIREQRGKSREGRLSLKAYHESGQVNIEISDDGGGIDPARVKATAIKRGVVGEERAARMTDRELIDLIFAPGFSTAEKVTNVSGRGVGMDVVKTNIEKIGGTIDLQSSLGLGTTMKIKIPLTLAIIPALIVTSGGDQYAIPQVSLLELLRLDADEAERAIEHVHGSPVYRLRGQLLPLAFLNPLLGVERPEERASLNIVVLQAGERHFGLVVDKINDTAEIVVKPLGKLLKSLSTFAGATIMGDGTVALILDVVGIAEQAGLMTESRETAGIEAAGATQETGHETERFLLFTLSSDRRFALPLSAVARLEEFRPEDVERSGDTEVVQYRDEILPLVHTADVLERGARPPLEPDQMLQVVVYNRGGRHVGLVVAKITDIVEQQLDVTRSVETPGLAGSAVIQGRVTDIVHLDSLLDAAGLRLPAPA